MGGCRGAVNLACSPCSRVLRGTHLGKLLGAELEADIDRVVGGARQAALPDVPTFAELGLAGFEDVPYYGLFAPAGTPKAAIDRIADAVAKVVALPEVRERLAAMGLTVGYMSPQQLTSREQAYTRTWARIIKASGFVAQ